MAAGEGEAVRPGANPMHGRDSHGWLASCLSVANSLQGRTDGIRYTHRLHSASEGDLSEGQLLDRPSGFRRLFRTGRLST